MIIFAVIFAVTTVTLSYIAKTAWGKGKLGEWWVKQEL
jgi:preprotein translocase subunit SecG